MPLQPKGRPPPMDARFRPGYFGGYVTGTNQHIILTEEGSIRCRSIKRRPMHEQWSADLLNCKSSLLQPNASSDESRIPIHVRMDSEPRTSGDAPDPPSTPSTRRNPYRFAIMKKDLEDYGYTEGCLGCETRRRQLPKDELRHHNDACRARLEPLIGQTAQG